MPETNAHFEPVACWYTRKKIGRGLAQHGRQAAGPIPTCNKSDTRQRARALAPLGAMLDRDGISDDEYQAADVEYGRLFDRLYDAQRYVGRAGPGRQAQCDRQVSSGLNSYCVAVRFR